jgi:hypothetical protein
VWFIHELPDPQDPDPTQYALLAATIHLLLIAYNHQLDRFQVCGYNNALDYYLPHHLQFAQQPHEVLGWTCGATCRATHVKRQKWAAFPISLAAGDSL